MIKFGITKSYISDNKYARDAKLIVSRVSYLLEYFTEYSRNLDHLGRITFKAYLIIY